MANVGKYAIHGSSGIDIQLFLVLQLCVFSPRVFPARHLGLEKQHGIPAGQGLEESSATQHDVCRVELLMAKVRVEVLFR